MKDNLKYMLENWLKWDKKSLIFFFIRVPALVFQPIITAFIPKAIIDCIESGVTVGRLTLIIALLSLLLTLTIWLDPFMRELVRGGARIVRMRYAVMAFEKNLSTDYANLESLEKREIAKRAEGFYNARFSGSASFVERLNQFFVCLIGVLVSSALLYKIDISMILIILASCVGEFIVLKIITKKQKKNFDDIAVSRTKFQYFYKISKDSDAAKDIELYGFKDYFISALAKTLVGIEKTISKYTHQSAAFNATRAILNLIRESVAWFYLVHLVTGGKLTVSDFIFYFGIITGFSNWIVNLVVSYHEIELNCIECQCYRDYIEQDDEKTGKDLISDIREVKTIEFKNVSFKYPGAENYALKNINLLFNAGEKIAVVGENGAGKTTLIKLLCGLYSVTEGEILINGINSKKISNSTLFDLFSAIFQDYYFLPLTVAENITASLDYDRDRLWSALKKAGIADKINSLPQKELSMMDKQVYKNAVDFSGGEKQKLLLSKAVYKDAPVLILDEPTAALDPIAENELYLKYNELTKNKLSFFISHRLSSTRFCDRILLVSNGNISEMGTHSELMAKKGAYYRMYQIQSYYYKEQGGTE